MGWMSCTCARPPEEALEHIRAGQGPFFLEIETYRFRGHSMGDPERYRKAEEVKSWQKKMTRSASTARP